jgi:NAD(P)H dehydrogenase (quinone)
MPGKPRLTRLPVAHRTGATTIAGGDGSRLPTANELQGGRYQGRKITETANKLQG